jgi:Fic/DOC family
MNFSFARKRLLFTCVAMTAVFAFTSISRAQMGGNPTNMMTSTNSMDEQTKLSEVYLGAGKDQDTAYKAFTKEQQPVRKVQLGNTFLQKFPKSPYAEHVDVGLMNAYHAQQDWKNTYLSADNALAIQPDDVDVLATVAWTIPHVYSPNDTDADQELNKAETYAKHAIDVLAKMPKPPDLNDAQFAASKAKRSIQAHSALGLVYFRREGETHRLLIEEFGGLGGIRDMGLLESAVLRAQNGYYSGLIEEASALMESLANNHAFIDGNKRISFVMTDAMLRANG